MRDGSPNRPGTSPATSPTQRSPPSSWSATETPSTWPASMRSSRPTVPRFSERPFGPRMRTPLPNGSCEPSDRNALTTCWFSTQLTSNASFAATPVITTDIARIRGSLRRFRHGNAPFLPRWGPTLIAVAGTSGAIQDSYADTTGWADSSTSTNSRFEARFEFSDTTGSLSPRGDWRAPSDASARAWLDELEAHV